ncbi:hypothetical protein JX266_006082 [Neoarthrinium moseri]|nr:hypothetical protein JX266_006082 [Neoarthrinium moseri]
MDKSELFALAHEYAKGQNDIYELLGIDTITAADPKQVQRAYRKQSIKYHPDKLGDRFDPEKWQLLERVRDVLMDTAAKAAYDSARSAKLIQEEKKRSMTAKRQADIADLEARERGEDPKRMRTPQKEGLSQAEYQSMLQKGNRIMEERKRLMREAEERERLAQAQKQPPPPTAAAAAAAAATTTGTKVGSEAGTKADAGQIPPKSTADDDPEIAALERKLEELRQKKAAKKAQKAARKGGRTSPSHGPQSISNPNISGPQADDQKKVFSFAAPAPSATPTSNGAAPAPAGKTDWASTMARLRAAQVEKERRKAEEAAAGQ